MNAGKVIGGVLAILAVLASTNSIQKDIKQEEYEKLAWVIIFDALLIWLAVWCFRGAHQTGDQRRRRARRRRYRDDEDDEDDRRRRRSRRRSRDEEEDDSPLRRRRRDTD